MGGALASLELPAVPGALTSLLGGLGRLQGAIDAAPRWCRFACARGGWLRAPCQETARGALVAAVARHNAGDAEAPQACSRGLACLLPVGLHGRARAPRLVAGRVLVPELLAESTASPRLSETHLRRHCSSVSYTYRCPLVAPPRLLFPLARPALDPPFTPTWAAVPLFFGDGDAPAAAGARHALVYQAGSVPGRRRHHRRRRSSPRACSILVQEQGQGQGVAQDGRAD